MAPEGPHVEGVRRQFRGQHLRLLCEIVNRVVCESLFSYEDGERRWGNQCIGCKPTRLRLVLLHFRVDNRVGEILGRVIDNKRTLTFMEKDVTNFVEQSEPKLVIGLVSQRQSDKGLLVGQPSDTSADPRVG